MIEPSQTEKQVARVERELPWQDWRVVVYQLCVKSHWAPGNLTSGYRWRDEKRVLREEQSPLCQNCFRLELGVAALRVESCPWGTCDRQGTRSFRLPRHIPR